MESSGSVMLIREYKYPGSSAGQFKNRDTEEPGSFVYSALPGQLTVLYHVRRDATRPGNIDNVRCLGLLHYIRGMAPRIALLEHRIAKSVTNLPQGRKKVLVKHPPIDV